jgi:tetratricopeptide (TPR) repeat protein
MLAASLCLLLSTASPAMPPAHPAVEPVPGVHPALGASADETDGGVDSKELLRQLDAMKEDLKNRPKTAEIEFALGNLYYENGRYPEAIDLYRQLLDRAAAPMARYLELRKLPHPAIDPRKAACTTAAQPTFEDLVGGAEAKAHAGEIGAAVVCYQAALLPMLAARARRGNAFFLIGNEDRAMEEHRANLAIEPTYTESLFFLGALLFETGDGAPDRLREAREVWKRYLATGPEPERERLTRQNLARIDSALANGGRMVQGPGVGGMGPMGAVPMGPPVPRPALTPDQQKALRAAVAEGARALGQRSWQEALAAFDRARQLDPADEEAARGAGQALMALGDRMKAEAAFRAALGRNPRDALALYELGEVFFQNQHYAGAARFWTQVLDLDPKVATQFKVKERIAEAQANAGG